MRALVRSRPPPSDAPSSEAALRELLRGRSVYDETSSNVTLAPFRLEQVSLPQAAGQSPELREILPDHALSYLEGYQERMLRPNSEVRDLEEQVGHIQTYTDPALTRNRRVYCKFIRKLDSLKLLRYTRCPGEFVGVFFVWKKGKKSIRMILDARRSNRRWHPPLLGGLPVPHRDRAAGGYVSG